MQLPQSVIRELQDKLSVMTAPGFGRVFGSFDLHFSEGQLMTYEVEVGDREKFKRV